MFNGPTAWWSLAALSEDVAAVTIIFVSHLFCETSVIQLPVA